MGITYKEVVREAKSMSHLLRRPAELTPARSPSRMAGSKQGAAVRVPKKRKTFTKAEKNTPEGRFAVHLRKLLDQRDWTVGAFHAELAAAGLDIKKPAVFKWLRGGGMPRLQDLETIGKVLGLEDYRDLMPPPR